MTKLVGNGNVSASISPIRIQSRRRATKNDKTNAKRRTGQIIYECFVFIFIENESSCGKNDFVEFMCRKVERADNEFLVRALYFV